MGYNRPRSPKGETKVVTIRGSALDDGALRAAIEEAGYEAA
jgi:hypothetical protein